MVVAGEQGKKQDGGNPEKDDGFELEKFYGHDKMLSSAFSSHWLTEKNNWGNTDWMPLSHPERTLPYRTALWTNAEDSHPEGWGGMCFGGVPRVLGDGGVPRWLIEPCLGEGLDTSPRGPPGQVLGFVFLVFSVFKMGVVS